MVTRTKRFVLQELVSPEIFRARADAAWELLDINALQTLDALSEYFGLIIINNWHAGGQFKESGFRSAGTSIGAQLSQHKFGRAFDCKPQKVTPREMYEVIRADPGRFPLLTTLENINSTPTWVHVDTRNNSEPGIRIVNP